MPNAHVFGSLVPPHDPTRPDRPFRLRDMAAVLNVVAALQRFNYDIGDLYLNYPPANDSEPPDRLLDMDLSDLRRGDLIVTGTRVPLSDFRNGDGKRVRRGWTSLEQQIIDLWWEYFEILSRSQMRLADSVADTLPGRYRDRREIEFRSREGSYYSRLNACDGTTARKQPAKPRTAAFLLRHNELWPGGPDYLGFFGMDGTSTLLWSWQLRHVLSDMLDRPGFTMVELEGRDRPNRPTTLEWMRSWKATPLVRPCS